MGKVMAPAITTEDTTTTSTSAHKREGVFPQKALEKWVGAVSPRVQECRYGEVKWRKQLILRSHVQHNHGGHGTARLRLCERVNRFEHAQ